MRTLPRDELARRRTWQPHLLVKFTQYAVRDSPAAHEQRDHYWSTAFTRYDYGNTGTTREFQPFVDSAGVIAGGMEHIQGPFGVAQFGDRLTLTLRNGEIGQPVGVGNDTGSRLKDFLEDGWPLAFGFVEVAEIRLDLDAEETLPDLTALVGTEHDVWYRGELDQVTDETGKILVLNFRKRVFGRNANQLLAPRMTSVNTTSIRTTPRDEGRVYNTIFGEGHGPVEVHAYDIGGVTSLAEDLPKGVTSAVLYVERNDVFRASNPLYLLIGNEIISTRLFGGPLDPRIIVQGRAQLGTTAADHRIGETILEIPETNGSSDDFKWLVSDLPADAVGLKLWQSPATGDLIRDVEASHGSDLSETSDAPDGIATPYARITINQANYLKLLQSIVAFGQAQTQQIGLTVDVQTSQSGSNPSAQQDQIGIGSGGSSGTSGPWSNLRNDDPNDIISFGLSQLYQGFVDFPQAPNNAAITSQFIHVSFRDGTNGSGDDQFLGFGIGSNTNIYSSLFAAGAGTFYTTRSYFFPGAGNRVLIVARGNAASSVLAIGEVERTITYIPSAVALVSSASVDITVDSEAAAAIGASLRLFLDGIKGVTAPDSNYVAASGDTLSHIADILRYIIAERMGLGHGVIDATTWGVAETNLAANTIGAILHELGSTDEEILARLCYEGMAQLTVGQGATDQVYRLHSAKEIAGGQWIHPASVRTLDQAKSFSVSQRPLSGIVNEANVLTQYDRSKASSRSISIEDFRHAEQIDPEHPYPSEFFPAVNVLPTTSDFIDRGVMSRSRREQGRREAPLEHAFVTVSGDGTNYTDARRVLGFYLNDTMRTRARSVFMKNVPWVDGLDLELGDIIRVRVPHLPTTQLIEPLNDTGTTDDWLNVTSGGGSTLVFNATDTTPEQGGTSLLLTTGVAKTDTSWRRQFVVDLSAEDELIQIDVRVAAGMAALNPTVRLYLSSDPTLTTDFDYVQWSAGSFVTNTWTTVSATIASRTTSAGTYVPGETAAIQIQIGHDSSIGGETIRLSNIRRGPLLKCKLVGYSKSLGGGNDRGRIDITAIEVP